MCIDFESTLKIIAFIVSIIALIKGIYEYTQAQKWKKIEFLSKEIKEFYNDFDIKRALILLDWNSNDLDLKPNEIEGKFKFYFNDNLIISALKSHKEIKSFTDEEIVIKSIFDCFFDRLTMFEIYINSGLIRTEDLRPYLIYSITILADFNDDRKSKEVREQIWKYIDEYRYDKIRPFCLRFGFNNQT